MARRTVARLARLFLLLTLFAGVPGGALAGACVPVGAWRLPDTAQPVTTDAILARLSAAPVVLLGERHDSEPHHRWQLDVIRALHDQGRPLALGLEMVPRRLQGALDRWVAGGVDEKTFLMESEWRTVWSFDPELYLPILRFARDNRLPLVALNVDKALVRRVGAEGWAAVPGDQREGVDDPAPAPPAYLDQLAAVHALHGSGAGDRATTDHDDPAFRRFVEAQLLWDRAMASRIAGFLRETGQRETGRHMVAIMGAGHLEERWGVPHQLADLGIADAMVLLPWDPDRDCADLTTTVADAVWGIAEPAVPRPRLGVRLEPTEAGVRVASVMPESVASQTGLSVGDVVVRADGEDVRQPEDLVRIVRRQAAGAALPLTIRREAGTVELTARFPAE